MATTSAQPAVHPFHIEIPQAALDDLRKQIATARLPEQETVSDASQGVQLAIMRALVQYWATDYDWRPVEARLNALPQFVTEIDGLDIHFIHVRSKEPNALPLLVTHGWPGSVIEQLKIIEPLTNPTAHGGSASDAFDVVIPSLPGYGFSGKPTEHGWNPARIGRAWDTLMKRLGYDHYVAQGGDWGAYISETMARQAPQGLLGIHVNLLYSRTPEVAQALHANAPAPAGFSEEEQAAYKQLLVRNATGPGYLLEQATHPQTIGFSLVEAPVGLAAWMIDHDERSYALIARAFTGDPGGLSRDDVLDNITLYWLTNTGASAARLYWEVARSGGLSVGDITTPLAVTVFPDETYQTPRSWAEQIYPHLIYYNRVDRGGHFAAWEQPQLFSEEVRAAFRSLR